MGMLVDVTALGGVWQFGIAATVLAVVGKVVGSGVPALFTGFNLFRGLENRYRDAAQRRGRPYHGGDRSRGWTHTPGAVWSRHHRHRCDDGAGAAGARALLPGGDLRTPVAGGYRRHPGKGDAMADSYEAVIPKVARELFQDSFIRYMTCLGFAHIAIGGRLGRYSTHEFKRDDDLVSMIVSSGGMNDLLVVVHIERHRR